jgi:hypothetical protein
LFSVLKNIREHNVLETGNLGWKEICNKGHVVSIVFLMNVAEAIFDKTGRLIAVQLCEQHNLKDGLLEKLKLAQHTYEEAVMKLGFGN